MIGFADILERCHEAGSFRDARRPLLQWQIPNALSCDGFLGIVVSVLGDAFQSEASGIQPRRGAYAAVPCGIVPGDADGNVSQWVVQGCSDAGVAPRLLCLFISNDVNSALIDVTHEGLKF